MPGRTFLTTTLIILSCSMFSHAADGRPAKRVLFIGIDGTRTDALLQAETPNLKKLRAEGAFSNATNILGTRDDKADTVSGPGWSNLLTGVWPDKHGVLNNKFAVKNYADYPHFFSRVKQAYPRARTVSLVDWTPIHELIVRDAEVSLDFTTDAKRPDYKLADERLTTKAVDILINDDPDVMMVYFGNVDETGHKYGFHPAVTNYTKAIETVDSQIGEVLAALHKRKDFAAEQWLILVGTDHGGRGTDHGGNRNTPEVNTVWCIVAGDGVQQGEIKDPTHQVDLVATALTHLGIPLKSEWKLDGRSIGLKEAN
jgi:predicted AlkP superfamily pyrophosphatase or phosphodiesterase